MKVWRPFARCNSIFTVGNLQLSSVFTCIVVINIWAESKNVLYWWHELCLVFFLFLFHSELSRLKRYIVVENDINHIWLYIKAFYTWSSGVPYIFYHPKCCNRKGGKCMCVWKRKSIMLMIYTKYNNTRNNAVEI